MANIYQEIVAGNSHVSTREPERTTVPERLLRALEAHAAAEAESMAAYERLGERSGDPLVALLMRLVLEDERRHHALLERMTRNLEEDGLALSPAGAVAGATGDGEAHGEAVLATRGLIREEREGARYLRHLARQEPRLYDGAYALLLETMARDGEKHEHILRFILRRLETRE